MHRDEHLLKLYVFISFYVDWSSKVFSLLLFGTCFFFFGVCSFSSLSHIFISIKKKKKKITVCWLLSAVCVRERVSYYLNETVAHWKINIHSSVISIHLFVNYAFISARPTFMLIAYFDCEGVCVMWSTFWSLCIVLQFLVFFSFLLYYCSCDQSLVIQCCELFFRWMRFNCFRLNNDNEIPKTILYYGLFFFCLLKSTWKIYGMSFKTIRPDLCICDQKFIVSLTTTSIREWICCEFFYDEFVEN